MLAWPELPLGTPAIVSSGCKAETPAQTTNVSNPSHSFHEEEMGQYRLKKLVARTYAGQPGPGCAAGLRDHKNLRSF